MGQAHIGQDVEVEPPRIEEVQRVTNGHMSSWLKILGVGEHWKHRGRTRETTINKSCNVSPMYLLVKDHKDAGTMVSLKHDWWWQVRRIRSFTYSHSWQT